LERGFVYLRAGRIARARLFAEHFDELASSLTAHDEVHAVGLHAVVESALALRDLAVRAERASAANDDFPCQFNWRTLLVCALGLAQLEEELQSRRLEEIGCATAVVAGPPELEPALLRLALLRGDEEEVRRILEVLPAMGGPWGLDGPAARLDALLALGEIKRLEEEAAPFLGEEAIRVHSRSARSGSRAAMRRWSTRLLRASEAMGLDWRAAETRVLSGATTRRAVRTE
jgi:hypothetical protein